SVVVKLSGCQGLQRSQPAQELHPVVSMKFRQSEQCVLLWTAAQPVLTAYIRTLVPDIQQADEVLQRVAVRMVRKFDQYNPSLSFAAWAIGFAKKEVLYYRRQRATDKHPFGDGIVEQLAVTIQQLVEE